LDVEQKVSLAVFVAAVCSVGLSFLLPFVSLPQKVTYPGPEVPYDGVNYTINGYYIPTVAQGTPINLTLCCYQPHDVFLSLFPSRESEIAPTAPSILTMNPVTNDSTSGSVLAPGTQPYGIFIIAYNHTAYKLTLSSVWSPFYVVRDYTEWLLLFALASGVLAYYYWETAERRRNERKVWAELAEQSRHRASFAAIGNGHRLASFCFCGHRRGFCPNSRE